MKKVNRFDYPDSLPSDQRTAVIYNVVRENFSRLAFLTGLILFLDFCWYWFDGSVTNSTFPSISLALGAALIVLLTLLRSRLKALPLSALRALQGALAMGVIILGLSPAFANAGQAAVNPLYILALLGVFTVAILPLMESLVLALAAFALYSVLLFQAASEVAVVFNMLVAAAASGLGLFLSSQLLDLRFELQVNRNFANDRKAQIDALAQRDPKTLLYNEPALRTRLAVELARAVRYRHPICLLVFEMDDFSALSRKMAPTSIDNLITGVAKIVNKTLRTTDIVGDFGDGHFVVVLPDTDLSNARNATARLQGLIDHFNVEQNMAISISCGLSQHHGEAMEALILITDARMRQAQKQGQNQIVTE